MALSQEVIEVLRSNAWLVVYAIVILILLSILVMIYFEEAKTKKP